MLAQMRQLTRGWLARILLIVISLLLAISLFQVDFTSGLQGVLTPNSMAVVAGRPISPQELDQRLDIYLKSATRDGEPITRADAVKARVPEQVLNELVKERAVFAYAARLGLDASDRVVGEAIHSLPVLRDPRTGTFNQAAYDRFLQELVGMSAPAFEEQMRKEAAAQQLMRALTDGVRAPRSFGEMQLALRSETRLVNLGQVPAERAGEIPEPTDAQVQELYGEMAQQRFRVPSFRAVTLATASLDDFVARANVPEERVREVFERNKERLSEPEKRSFVQIIAQTNAQANQAAQRLARGESAASVAQALNLQHIAFTQKPQAEVPDSAVARAVFAMRSGAPPQVVRGTLGAWSAVAVSEVVPGTPARFEDARDEIRDDLARQEAQGSREEAITHFSEAIEEGTPIAQAAAAHGLRITVVPAVNEQGRTPAGEPAEAFAGERDLLRAAFETEQGEVSDFIPTQNGQEALVQVDNITPERTLPLAQVRPVVVEWWKGQERARRLTQIGERIVQAVNSGRPFAEVVAAEGGRVSGRSDVISRMQATQSPPEFQQISMQMFSVREGEAAMGLNPTATTVYLAQIQEIRRDNPTEHTQVIEQFRQEAQRDLLQGLGLAIQRETVLASDVQRNPKLLERAYPRTPQADAAER